MDIFFKNPKSALDYTAFKEMKVKEKVSKTFISGVLVAEDGELVKESPIGKHVY